MYVGTWLHLHFHFYYPWLGGYNGAVDGHCSVILLESSFHFEEEGGSSWPEMWWDGMSSAYKHVHSIILREVQSVVLVSISIPEQTVCFVVHADSTRGIRNPII